MKGPPVFKDNPFLPPILEGLASHEAWKYHLDQDDVQEMDDAEALRIFRTTAFLHTSVK